MKRLTLIFTLSFFALLSAFAGVILILINTISGLISPALKFMMAKSN